MWSHQQVSVLIAMYRENQCLYVPKNPLYKNRNARNQAVEKIKAELSKSGLEVSTLDVKNKWNNLRNNFLAQYRKYIATVKCGTGDEEQELDRPTLWYFDEMEFIVEHSCPRKSEDSLSQVTANTEHDYQEQEESEREYESEEVNLGDRMSFTSRDYYLSEDENEERDNEVYPAKKIKIQSVHVIKEPNSQTIASSCSTPVPTSSVSRKKKGKTNKSEDEDFMKTAAKVLTNLTNTLEHPVALPVVQTPPPKNAIQTFVDFVGSQLEYLTSNQNILLETQEQT